MECYLISPSVINSKKMNFTVIKDWWTIIKTTFGKFSDDKGLKLSAALAYYTIFSITPLLVIIIGVGSIFYGKEAIQGEIFQQISSTVGTTGAAQIQDMLQKTSTQYNNIWATIIGIITLLLGASGIFGEIQESINLIWKLKPKANKGFLKLVINRLLSFSMIVVLGFVLLVSLVLNALLAAFLEKLKQFFPESVVKYFFIIDYAVMFMVIVILFAAIFKVLPDAKIKWKEVFTGAIATSVLFFVGKYLIGFYLSHFGNVSAYGSAGSVLIILLWVYYTAIILYLGAEFTHQHIRFNGRSIEPLQYAVWDAEADKKDQVNEGSKHSDSQDNITSKKTSQK